MLSYVLEVSMYWGVFSLIFHLFLRKLTFFTFNRWYLISSLVLGLILPLISFNISTPTPVVEDTIYLLAPISNSPALVEASLESSGDGIPYRMIFLSIYWAGVTLFGFQFFIGLAKIYHLYRTGHKIRKSNFTLVRTRKPHLPFSFFNMIFWSDDLDSIQDGDDKIMLHEISHVKDRHSFDVLLIEITRIFLWCSPFIYWYKRSMRQIHEYIADHMVLRTTQLKNYGHLLLKQSQSGMQLALANHFIHSQLKNRITMMLQKPSGRMAKLKYLLILPVILGLGLLISAKSFEQNDPNFKVYAEKQELIEGTDYIIQGDQVEIINQQLIDSNTPIEVVSKSKNVEKVFGINERIPGLISIKRENGEIVAIFRIFEYEGGIKQFIQDQVIIPSDQIIQMDVSKNGEGPLVMKYADLKPEQMMEIVIRQETKLEFITNLGLSYDEADQSGNQLVYDVYQDNIEIKKIDFIERELTKEIPAKTPQKPAATEMYTTIETMPRFPGCEEYESAREKELCAQKKMLQFIYTNIRYPKASREAGIEGMNIVQFNVEEDGSLSNIRLVKSVDDHTGNEALRIVTMMADLPGKWIPGTMNGQPVKTTYNLPIKFKLEGEKEKPGDLFVVLDKEGQVYGHYDQAIIEKIPKEAILSINVMSGEDAAAKYPKKTKLRSVTEIHTNWGKEDFFMHGLSTSQLTVVGYGNKKEKPQTEELFKVVEQMPRFPGCEEISGTNMEKEECAKKQMLQFIYENIQYPKEAKDKAIQGMNVIRFVVEKDGTLSNFEAVRQIDESTAKESIRILELMNDKGMRWTPGYQKGQPVRVLYNLPIRFKLDQNTIDQPRIKSTKEDSNSEGDESYLILVFDKSGALVHEYYNGLKPDDLNFGQENGRQDHFLTTIEPEAIESITVLKDRIQDKYPERAGVNALVEVHLKWSRERYEKVLQEKTERAQARSDSQDIFKSVDQMPRFPGCESNGGTDEEKEICSKTGIMEFVGQNLQYPEGAKKHRIEGLCVIRFIVDKDGTITNPEIVKDIGAHCGDEALRIVKLMNTLPEKWTPGKQKGQPVRVEYNLPIRFKLSEGKTSNGKPDPAMATSLELDSFRAFPNPTDNRLNISFITEPGHLKWSVLDASGKEMIQEENKSFLGVFNQSVNLKEAAKGTAILRFDVDGKQYIHKVILQ